MEANIEELHERIHRESYRAKPSLRLYISKPDGRKRPLGIASLEDKIVQQAVLWVLQSIYEQDFLGFSYGFRRGRSQHDALDALSVAINVVARRWLRLFPQRREPDGSPAEPEEHEISMITGDAEKLTETRRRLSDVSWWVRCTAENIARRSNKEARTGRSCWFLMLPSIDSADASVVCQPFRCRISS